MLLRLLYARLMISEMGLKLSANRSMLLPNLFLSSSAFLACTVARVESVSRAIFLMPILDL